VVELEGRRVEDSLPARQGRLLFAYLALNRDRPVRREELIDCIWPQHPPADAAGALNSLVSRLRRALGAGVIEGRAELSLALPRDAEIDLASATEALARARSAAADHDWQATWGPAHVALTIAQRGLLPELEGPWIDERRRELEQIELDALELVAETGLGLGGSELAAAERAANTLVERAAFRESGHRVRMRVLVARGNLAEALQAYEELRQLLREELGTAPSPDLVALHERLLHREAAPDLGAPGRKLGRSAVRPSGPAASKLIGRERELTLLEAALDATRDGARRLVLVSGDAGIGKTRLIEELAEQAASSGAEVLWGRCYEGQGAPAFWPWMEVVRASAKGRRPEQLRRALGAGAGDLGQIVPELRELFPDLEPARMLDAEAARFRLYDSLSGFLTRLAATRRLVVLLDDLHWGDAPSLELLQFVASRPDDAPILIAGTYRDVELASTHPLADTLAQLPKDTRYVRLELTGLGEDAVGRLISNATGDVVSQPLAAAVQHRTKGNPFFVSELVRLLESREELGGGDAEAVFREKLPVGVRDVIRRRLARLPERSAELLTLAAVAGEEFELETLALSAELDGEDALKLLEPALGDRIVSDSPTAPGRYRFSHALIRETIYAEPHAMARAQLHRHVGEALERLRSDDEDYLIELADHFYEAAAAGSVEKAYSYAARAAEQAMGRLAYEQAEQQLRRGLELVRRLSPGPERASRELDLQVRLSGQLMMTMGYGAAEVGEACSRAEELCREVGDERQLLPSLWRLGVFHEVRADYAKQEQIGARLLELGHRAHDPAFRLSGTMMLAPVAINKGRFQEARALLEEAMAIADSLEAAALVDTFGQNQQVTPRGFLAWVLSLLGNEDRARELTEEALSGARRLPNPIDEAFALFFDAFCAVIAGDARSARGRTDELLALCAEHGLVLFSAMGTILRGWTLAEQGETRSGAAMVEEGLVAFEATGARMMLHCFLALLADALQQGGQIGKALIAVEDGLSKVDPTTCFYEAELHRLKGELLAAAEPSRRPRAEAELRTAIAIARAQQARPLELRAESSLHDFLGE